MRYKMLLETLKEANLLKIDKASRPIKLSTYDKCLSKNH